MRKRFILPLLLAGASLAGLPRALAEVVITLSDGHVIRVSQVDRIDVNQGADGLFVVTYADGTTESFGIGDITGMTFSDEDITDPITPDPSDDEAVITVEWRGAEAPAVMCSAPGVTVTTEGGNVFITNTNTDTEYTYILRGQSSDGSLTLTADYKSTIRLDGLALQSGLEEALNIKCGKRVALVVNDGTENTLADATTDNGQKGALYCKGHLELEGGGTLSLTGHAKHGLSTKEYLQLKKGFTGQLNVVAAASDGIHAGQYFQMNGGNVSIKGVGGDGIQAEATTNAEDEQNGQIIVKDGTLDVTTTATDVAALKSDADMNIQGGTFTLNTSGAGDKALKSKTNVSISGGTFAISQSGKPCIEDGDLGYVTAVKGTDVSISGGTFSINTTGIAGRGFSADNLSISDAANVTLTNSAVAGTSADAVEVTAEPDPTPDPGTPEETPKSYRVYVNVPTSGSGGGGRPGGGTSSNAWSAVALYNSNGTLVSNVSTTVNVNGTTFYYYDFKQSTTGTYYFGNPNGYTSGYTSYTIKTSTFSGPTDGKDHYYKASTQYSTSGSTRTYNLSDVTSQYEGGTIGGGTTGSADVITPKGIKTDADLHLTGGTINIKMSGKGGKGIKVDGNAYVGDATTGQGPTLSIVTTGAAAGGGTSGGGGGGWGGFGGEGGSGGTTKAMKVTGQYWQYGGNLYVNTASAEGIESKTKSATSMNFNGGTVYLYCSDDCINSAGAINFGGAHVMAISYNNDAIDSNYGQSGSLVVTGGTVIAFSTRGGAEMGFDCDANSRIVVSGGTLIAGGGSQGGSGSTSLGSGSQHYKVWSANLSYTAGNYYSVVQNGRGICTFCLPVGLTSTYNFYACEDFTSNQSCSIVRTTTPPTDGTAVNFRTKASDLTGQPLFWRPTSITSGTSLTTVTIPN